MSFNRELIKNKILYRASYRGTKEMDIRLERVLTNDPGLGVVRHADAGYKQAVDFAKLKKIKIPNL